MTVSVANPAINLNLTVYVINSFVYILFINYFVYKFVNLCKTSDKLFSFYYIEYMLSIYSGLVNVLPVRVDVVIPVCFVSWTSFLT